MEFRKYKRKGLSEMIPLKDFTGEMSDISVSDQDDLLDREVFNQGYVARNPKNHLDLWYVAKKYFDDNLEPEEKETTFLERLEEEKNDLLSKMLKLSSFIQSEKFKNIDPIQKSLLKAQNSAMNTYWMILSERVKNL